MPLFVVFVLFLLSSPPRLVSAAPSLCIDRDTVALFLCVGLVWCCLFLTCGLLLVGLRSKKKMLARKDSDDDRSSSCPSTASTSLPPVSPCNPPPGEARLASLRPQKSSRSDSFKALLLRKGTRSASHISAAERLRVATSPVTYDLSLSREPPQSPIMPPCGQSMPLEWRQSFPMQMEQLLLASSCSSSFLFLSSSSNSYPNSSENPRSHTPPCSASRRYAARYRLHAAPMTAIFEAEAEQEEEDKDDDVFIDSLEAGGAPGPRLLKIS